MGSSGNSPPVRLPDRRLLKAFRFDPMSTRLAGRHLSIDIPFEPSLRPGPVGDLVQVIDYDPGHGCWYEPVDLDDPAILAQRGLRPSERDPRTHQQVVYAVSMSVIERFERFLGRRFRWRRGRPLRLVPHAFEGRNAYFDPDRDAVLFGYYRAERDDPGPNLPGQMMFTALSVDIIAHEVTHAVVHRLRPWLSEATNPDVFAWHEACADLVALFHHFAFREVVAEAVANSRGRLQQGTALLDLAREFGESTGRGAALRSAVGSPATPDAFLSAHEPHERGACFVAAVFDAYLDAYRARIADLRRLASGGTGALPAGALPPDLVSRVTTEAIDNADRLLGMVVRAFDFLPVVDVTFGDVVRAIVTADRALFPDDGLQLRAVLVEALRRRGIYPPSVSSLADEALTWPRPPVALSLADGPGVDLSGLILAATRDLDVEVTASAEHGATSGPRGVAAEGLALTGDAQAWATHHALALGLDPGTRIEVSGIHVAYHRAADEQPRPVVVVQLGQRRPDLEDTHPPEADRIAMRAGTTVVARVSGRVDYIVAKPLPLPESAIADVPDELRGAVRAHQEAGRRRLATMRGWSQRLDEADPLAAWTREPAQRRLTFARLHAGQAHEGG